METGHPKGIVTFVAFGDGSTSLYFSNGGGVIGAGEHEQVRKATGPVLSMAEVLIRHFTPLRKTSFTGIGRVQFYVKVFGGMLTAEAAEDDLGNGRHALSPLFHKVQAAIAAVLASKTEN